MSKTLSHPDPTPHGVASPALQADRRTRVQTLHRLHCFDGFHDDGSPVCGEVADWRGNLWHSLSLLVGNEAHVRRANAMLRHARTRGGGHFWSSAACSILVRFSDRLEADVRAGLLERVSELLEGEVHQRFRGYNDNFPAMAAVTLILGAELTGQSRYREAGLACLRSGVDLLNRRGVLSEYGSPTYTPIVLTCMAEIVEHSADTDARRLARRIEQQVWFDLLGRFHPPTSTLAGPYSRAYTVDLCAHPHNAHVVLYQVLGDAVFVNPTNALFPYVDGRQVRHGRGDFIQAHAAWHSTPTYHVPAGAVALALEKPMPSVMRVSSEQAAYPRNFWKPERHPHTPLAECAAGPMHPASFFDHDFAFGTADRPFLDGCQFTPFHAVYRRRAPAKDLRDVGTLFSRFISDDRPPRADRLIVEEGRALAVAAQGAAMLLYRPNPTWGCTPLVADHATTPVQSLKVSLVVPCQYGRPEEIWIGGERARPWCGESVDPASVYLRDGRLYVALHPLTDTNFGRSHAVRLEETDGFGLISLVHYQGPPRIFSDSELMACRAGFVIELAGADDWPSFEAFRQFHAAPEIQDTWHEGDAMRQVTYRREGLELAMRISPFSDGIQLRTVNGSPVPEPRFEIVGEGRSLRLPNFDAM